MPPLAGFNPAMVRKTGSQIPWKRIAPRLGSFCAVTYQSLLRKIENRGEIIFAGGRGGDAHGQDTRFHDRAARAVQGDTSRPIEECFACAESAAKGKAIRYAPDSGLQTQADELSAREQHVGTTHCRSRQAAVPACISRPAGTLARRSFPFLVHVTLADRDDV